MKPVNCTYPNCFVCKYSDCQWDNPERDIKIQKKKEKYNADIENKRRKQREYRKRKNTYRDEMGLNKNQRNMYEFILNYVQRNLYSPAITEIADAVGISTSTVQSNLLKIQKVGLISLGRGQRAIRLNGYELVQKGAFNGKTAVS